MFINFLIITGTIEIGTNEMLYVLFIFFYTYHVRQPGPNCDPRALWCTFRDFGAVSGRKY
jgi:hypothetical protein